jgi:hypothetical protein
MSTSAVPHHGNGRSGRPAWLVPVVVAAAVLVVGGIVLAFVLTNRGTPAAPPTPPPTTIVLPSPTPTITPVARENATAFTAVLPASVLQYALASSVADDERLAAGAIEAWLDTYGDGADGQIVVRSSQWLSPDEATAFAATLVAGLPTAAPEPAPSPSSSGGDDEAATGPDLPTSGNVEAGGVVVGAFTIVDAGDGTGVAVWTNGTAVFQLTAPLDDVVDAYSAFPL